MHKCSICNSITWWTWRHLNSAHRTASGIHRAARCQPWKNVGCCRISASRDWHSERSRKTGPMFRAEQKPDTCMCFYYVQWDFSCKDKLNKTDKKCRLPKVFWEGAMYNLIQAENTYCKIKVYYIQTKPNVNLILTIVCAKQLLSKFQPLEEYCIVFKLSTAIMYLCKIDRSNYFLKIYVLYKLWTCFSKVN